MDARRLLITNATLIDGRGGPPRAEAAVLVEGELIAWAGPGSQAPDAEAILVDAGALPLLPGLVDCHVHLCHDAPLDLFAQARDDSVPIATLRAAANARAHLAAGTTTVRDCGAAGGVAIELAKAIERGMVPGPRVQPAGLLVTMTGGHGHFIGREADGPDEVRKAVRQSLKDGAQVVKVMATGGVLTPGVEPTQTAFTMDELRAAAEEAHNAGKRTSCHAIGNQGIKNALRAGIDSIEHGFYLDDEAIELFLETGAYLVPTLVAVEGIVVNGTAAGIPDWVVRKAESESGHHRESFEKAVAAGVRIASGTDAGTPFNPHGNLPRELELMVEFGMPTAQALVATTASAAANLGLEAERGTIEAGKRADLVLLGSDPLADIGAVRDVRLVLRDGRVVHGDAAALSRELQPA
jgi:imidazolonepropionase-like amidohydrolase